MDDLGRPDGGELNPNFTVFPHRLELFVQPFVVGVVHRVLAADRSAKVLVVS